MAEPLIRETGGGGPGGANPGAAGGGGLSKKMMGLPAWAWVALAAAGGAIFFVWRSKGKSADAAATTSTTPVDSTAQGLDVEQYESILALLRDIQGTVSTIPGEDDSGGDTSTTPPPVTTTPPPPAKTPTAPKPKPKTTAHKTVTVSKFTTASAARGSNWASTLSTIAAHEHTTVSKLMKLNPGIKNANLIHPGQKVVVT